MPEQHHGAGPARAVVRARPGDDDAREGSTNDGEAEIRQARDVDGARKVLRRVPVTHRAKLGDHLGHAWLERGDAQESVLTCRSKTADTDDRDRVDAGRRVGHRDDDWRGSSARVDMTGGILDPERHRASRVTEGGLDEAVAREAVGVRLLLAVVDRRADEVLLGARRRALAGGVGGCQIGNEGVVGLSLN